MRDLIPTGKPVSGSAWKRHAKCGHIPSNRDLTACCVGCVGFLLINPRRTMKTRLLARCGGVLPGLLLISRLPVAWTKTLHAPFQPCGGSIGGLTRPCETSPNPISCSRRADSEVPCGIVSVCVNRPARLSDERGTSSELVFDGVTFRRAQHTAR